MESILNFIKDIWKDIRELFINIIGGFLAKQLIFLLSYLIQLTTDQDRKATVWINTFDDIISALVFYVLLLVGLAKFVVSAYYSAIDHKNIQYARVKKRKNKLLDESLEELPGSTGTIMEEVADDINQFNPSEED